MCSCNKLPCRIGNKGKEEKKKHRCLLKTLNREEVTGSGEGIHYFKI